MIVKIHPRIIKADPWQTVNSQIESLIDKIIIDKNPLALDDEMNDLLDNPENREKAIDKLVEKLEALKEK